MSLHLVENLKPVSLFHAPAFISAAVGFGLKITLQDPPAVLCHSAAAPGPLRTGVSVLLKLCLLLRVKPVSW